jgi:hypothetical protein
LGAPGKEVKCHHKKPEDKEWGEFPLPGKKERELRSIPYCSSRGRWRKIKKGEQLEMGVGEVGKILGL